MRQDRVVEVPQVRGFASFLASPVHWRMIMTRILPIPQFLLPCLTDQIMTEAAVFSDSINLKPARS